MNNNIEVGYAYKVKYYERNTENNELKTEVSEVIVIATEALYAWKQVEEAFEGCDTIAVSRIGKAIRFKTI